MLDAEHNHVSYEWVISLLFELVMGSQMFYNRSDILVLYSKGYEFTAREVLLMICNSVFLIRFCVASTLITFSHNADYGHGPKRGETS